MTETFSNLKESYKIYKCYLRLYRQGILKVKYTFEQVYETYRDNREVIESVV